MSNAIFIFQTALAFFIGFGFEKSKKGFFGFVSFLVFIMITGYMVERGY